MSDNYDVIIVGARCAGSPTAMLLARRGYRVLLVDKATFPSDTVSTHFVLHGGLRLMKEWGLLDRLLATNCPPIEHFTNYVDDFALMATLESQDGVPPSMAPRRIVLDRILAEAAVEAGVELREGFAVHAILMDGERVTGIRGGEKGGPLVDVHAPLVIGADGKNSLLARSVDAPLYNNYPTFAFWYYSYWENVDIAGTVMYWQPRRAVGGWPTHDGRVMAGMGRPIDEYQDFRQDAEVNYLKAITTMPGFGERFTDGRMVERLVGMADIPNFFRQSYGEGWALVGDAGYFKDPIRGHVINDAFYSADILSRKIDEGLRGKKPLMQALAEYQTERDEMMLLDYEINCRTATLLDWNTPNHLQLRRAVRGNEEATRAYLGVVAGIVPYRAFYNSENIGRIIAAASV